MNKSKLTHVAAPVAPQTYVNDAPLVTHDDRTDDYWETWHMVDLLIVIVTLLVIAVGLWVYTGGLQ